ncbi:CPBP family intramembrane glutamic endopeptidase [Corynebacterium cystitidis]|uniref:CAAX protease self-immunity n=1 Tax=Corynebacterium cystitidis DSM 20524 TaxID=1121357 RepID=A0A1H9T7K1_9CORY|nr:CPBP family intramembrane glutamic endopeptidase [Corynebacterium cystitidis]WJY83492.1 CAAX amino terminal protease self- immunity [Corynebacterium cystitidis DSM 20524]SER93230.1 CAAX protease self-immunity [Corynebacterium cystitidis DSM 20524]SNV92509.1 CAAX amino terminal protease self- immunity [Corynebacterium cystitidis]
MKKFSFLILPLIHMVVMAGSVLCIHRVLGVVYGGGHDFVVAMIAPIMVLFLAVSLYWRRNRHKFELRPSLGWSLLLIPGIPVALLGFVALARGGQSAGAFFALLLLAVGVGVVEEVIYRGVVVGAMARQFSLPAVVWGSGALFGLAHAVNIFGGQAPSQTVQQVLSTAVSGVAYAVFYLYVRRLSPLIMLHATWDFVILSRTIDDGSAWHILLTLIPILEIIAAIVIWVKFRQRLALYDDQ